VSHPGIAVHQPPAGPPEVVVAFYLYDASATPPDVGSRIVRRLGPFNWQGVSGFVTPIFNFSLVTNTFPYSLSLTVSTDGTYLLAASDVVNSVSRVTFVRGAAVSWKKLATTYPVNIAHAVSVYGTDSSQFNIASTAFPQTPPSYGLGARRAVGWPLSAQTPFWQGPQPLEAESKNPRATNIRICNGNSLCVINAVFARRNGNSSEIVTDVTCTQSPLCPNGVKLCIPDATAEMTRVHVPNATNGLHRAPAGTSIVSSGPRPCVVARTKSASR